MAQPTGSSLHVDAVLSNISVAYAQDASHFIADKVFPVVPVAKQTDKYYIYTKNDFFRDEARKRGNNEESAGTGYNLSTDTYSCDVFALHKDIGDLDRANEDNPLDGDRDAVMLLMQKMMLRREIQWVSDCFATGVWGTDVVGGTNFTLWSDASSSNPIKDIRAGRRTILENTGFLPNTLVVGYEVFDQLVEHPMIIDRYKHDGSAKDELPEQALARVLGVPRVLVSKAVKATNNEGGTAAYDFVAGKNALLCYSAPAASLRQPSAGYHMSWRGLSGALGLDFSVKKFRIESRASDRIEAQMAFDHKVVAADLGYFFSAAVS